MPNNGMNFKGCKVFITNKSNCQMLASTTVLSHDTDRVAITIDGKASRLNENDKVVLLILKGETIYEYHGTVRRADKAGFQEIALFKGRTKEDREAIRYTVNVPALIVNVNFGSTAVAFLPPANALIVNISTNGILLRSSSQTFNMGMSFQFKIIINQDISLLNARVTRINQVAENEFEYGCVLTGRE